MNRGKWHVIELAYSQRSHDKKLSDVPTKNERTDGEDERSVTASARRIVELHARHTRLQFTRAWPSSEQARSRQGRDQVASALSRKFGVHIQSLSAIR